MKTRIFTTLLLIICMKMSFSQGMIVSDPGTYARLAENLANTSQLLEDSSENVQMGKEALSKLQKINSAIRDSQLAVATSDNLYKAIEKLNEIPELISNMPYRNKAAIFNQADELLGTINVFISVYIQVMSSNLLEMGDGNRTTLLLELHDKSLQAKKDVNSFKAKVLRFY